MNWPDGFLVGGRRLDRLDRIDLEECLEHRVQREEGRGHARAGRKNRACSARAGARPSRVLVEQLCDTRLFRRLSQRDVPSFETTCVGSGENPSVPASRSTS
jgi:hypothetical protein